ISARERLLACLLSLHDALPICRVDAMLGAYEVILAPERSHSTPAACQGAVTGNRRHGPSGRAISWPKTITSGSPGSPGMLEPLRSEEHTSELQSRENLVCRLLL